ncbi:P4a major core protein precursor [Equine molluscum contagiosum-like virus]|nr:P4a major core protein precursor [Equine molluscum contagiosum-like virus]
MMPVNSLITLEQLESSEYVFRLMATILPSLCLDYKVDPALEHTYVHPFDALYHGAAGEVAAREELERAAQQLGINYLLDGLERQYFPAMITARGVELLPRRLEASEHANPISCTHAFADLPLFTRELVKLRLSSFEAHARFFGGYVRAPDAPAIRSPVSFPALSFENTYLASMVYPHTVGNERVDFRARLVDGVMVAKDLANLLAVRALLAPAARAQMDADYALQAAAQDHHIAITPNPAVDTELTTMSLKPLVLYFQYFADVYDLGPLTFNGELVLSNPSQIGSFAASLHYQKQVQRLQQEFRMPTRDSLELYVHTAGGVVARRVALPGVQFLEPSWRTPRALSLLAVLARAERAPALQGTLSLFWDGMPYEDYKQLKLTDLLFYGAACYLFALYEKNGITFCSLLQDVTAAGETPLRVCVLPRVVAGKTVPKLVAETLRSINAVSPRDFPRHTGRAQHHVGLSEQGFMRFFQMLRLLGARAPEVAVKEVLMAYAGVKLGDQGAPHPLRAESYQTFVLLLFGAMGFRVSVHRDVVASHNYTTYSVTPRVSRHHLTAMLQKAGCSRQEAEKLLSSAHDLISFMLAAGNLRSGHSYRYCRRWAAGARGGDDAETLVQFVEPVGILERIHVPALLGASTLDEMVDADAFLPENAAFRRHLQQLIDTEQLSGEAVTHVMPLSLLDRLVTAGGAAFVSLGSLMDSIADPAEDCDATNEVVEMINAALRDSYAKEASALTAHTINAVAARSEQQMHDVRQSACQVAGLFKNLARSIYATERLFKARISDEVKADILEKYKAFVELSKALYYDLISLEHIKALLYIVKRSGRSLEETEIGPEELRKSYELIRPKITRLTNYYNDISRSYFEQMKKNLNMGDASAVSFDTE